MSLPILRYFWRTDDDVQLANYAKIPWQSDHILQQSLFQMKICEKYKYEVKSWQKTGPKNQNVGQW